MSDSKQKRDGGAALDYPTFMQGLVAAPYDNSRCESCGGTGWRSVLCCNGYMCGCQGMPVDFKPCPEGCAPATEEQIAEWAMLAARESK